MKMKSAKEQMELTFESPLIRAGKISECPRRLANARWWFAQMHAVVDRAFDWSPAAPAPRPEQIRMELPRPRLLTAIRSA